MQSKREKNVSILEAELKIWELLCNKIDENTMDLIIDVLKKTSSNRWVIYIGEAGKKEQAKFWETEELFAKEKNKTEFLKGEIVQIVEELLPNLADELKQKLFEFISLNEEDNAKRFDTLSQIFPEAALVSEMKVAQCDASRIDVVDKYLKNGFENISKLIFQIYEHPEVIKYIIEHDASVDHLAHIFKECLRLFTLKYSLLCLKQEKFTSNPDEYFKKTGEKFNTSILRMLGFCSRSNSMSYLDPDMYQDLIKAVLEKCPSLMNGKDLWSMVIKIITSPFYEQFGSKQNSNEEGRLFMTDEKINVFLQKIILLIVDHPEYPFTCSFNYKGNPLHFAAKFGCKEIFSRFYFHENTLDSEKKKAIQILKENDYGHIIKEISSDLSKADRRLFIFFVAMQSMEYIPPELKCMIYEICLKVAYEDYILMLETSVIPPQKYTPLSISQLSLFPKASINNWELIKCAAEKIKDYMTIDINENGKRMNRALSFLRIFENGELSTDFKMLSLYALLNEEMTMMDEFKGNILKNYLQPDFHCFMPAIQKTAERYARDHKLNILISQNALIERIHGREINGCQQDDYFCNINEIEIVRSFDSVISEKRDENCLMM